MFKKKARRKEFDLAILNMAALVKIGGDKDDTIEVRMLIILDVKNIPKMLK